MDGMKERTVSQKSERRNIKVLQKGSKRVTEER